MRRKQFEITDLVIIEEILSRSEVCRIAMIDNGRPYIVPLNYGYRNNSIYFHSSPHGKKIELLKHDNRVCFEIELSSRITRGEKPCDWGTKYRSVIGYGTVGFITDFNGKKEGLDIIMSHYGKTGNNEYSEKEVENVLILKLQIEEITGKQKGDWNDF